MKKKIGLLALAVTMMCGLFSVQAYAGEPEKQAADAHTVETVAESSVRGEAEFANATPIVLNNTVNGSITETARERIYKFSLSKAGRVTLNMTSYMRWYCMYVYDSTGTKIWYTDGNEWNESLGKRSDSYDLDLRSGDYYVKVMGYYSESYDYGNGVSTGTYSVGTKFVSANETYPESNNDFLTASVIGTQATVNGQIAMNDRYDIYKFNMPKAGRIDFDITSYMRWYCVYLYDENGDEVWNTYDNEWNENLSKRSDSYELDLKSGTYYLKVMGYYSESYDYGNGVSTGNYTFTMKYTDANVNYKEPNNDFQTAYALGADTTIKGQIALNDRFDIFQFALNEAKDIQLDMTSYMRYYCIYIYDASGKEIWNTYSNEWEGNVGYRKDTHKITLSAGKHYLKVTGYRYNEYDGSTGTYKLRVNTKSSVVNASVKSITDKAYTGKAIRPSVTVTYNGRRLTKGTDYTLTYKNNKKMGTASVIVKGTGSYTGSKTVKFKIVPKKVTVKTVKNSKKATAVLSWKRDTSVSGYEIYRSTSKSSGYKKVKTISNNKTVTYQNKSLKKEERIITKSVLIRMSAARSTTEVTAV